MKEPGGLPALGLTSGTAGSAGNLTVTSGIFATGFGVTASVVTANGQSMLSLASLTEGSFGGALTASSNIVATSDTPLSYSGSAATSTANSSGSLSEIPNEGDVLSGSISVQAGSGVAQTIHVPSSPNNNLSGLADAINTANIGVVATVAENNDGMWSLSLWSQTSGNDGNLTVTSNILDASNTSSATLDYMNSSDINSLTTLGISVNNDGTLTFDASSLDSMLNTDFSGVVGFFQGANGWGQSFNAMLTQAGTVSSKGILKLAAASNSNIESTLNANISREESLISAQQISLTAELNSANEIMQALPRQLEGINQLYSAITGYNQNLNG